MAISSSSSRAAAAKAPRPSATPSTPRGLELALQQLQSVGATLTEARLATAENQGKLDLRRFELPLTLDARVDLGALKAANHPRTEGFRPGEKLHSAHPARDCRQRSGVCVRTASGASGDGESEGRSTDAPKADSGRTSPRCAAALSPRTSA